MPTPGGLPQDYKAFCASREISSLLWGDLSPTPSLLSQFSCAAIHGRAGCQGCQPNLWASGCQSDTGFYIQEERMASPHIRMGLRHLGTSKQCCLSPESHKVCDSPLYQDSQTFKGAWQRINTSYKQPRCTPTSHLSLRLLIPHLM